MRDSGTHASRFDVTTFGEALVRLSVPAGRRMETTSGFDVDVSGTEANVVGALSRLGWRCGWVSALPESPLGRCVQNKFRGHGIDLSSVTWRPDGRIATYFVEFAHEPRPIRIYYDRKDSCFTHMRPEDIDWDYLLNTRHLHLTGLSVPLGPSTGEITENAVRRAKSRGVTTSIDVNYRSLLWTIVEARERLGPLIDGVDLLMCSSRDAKSVFGCEGSAESTARQMADVTGAANIVLTLGEEGVIAFDGSRLHREAAKPVKIIDRIGAGDAMAAGVLHGWLQGSLQAGLRYGTAMAALALSQFGDTVVTHSGELDLILDDSATDIQR